MFIPILAYYNTSLMLCVFVTILLVKFDGCRSVDVVTVRWEEIRIILPGNKFNFIKELKAFLDQEPIHSSRNLVLRTSRFIASALQEL